MVNSRAVLLQNNDGSIDLPACRIKRMGKRFGLPNKERGLELDNSWGPKRWLGTETSASKIWLRGRTVLDRGNLLSRHFSQSFLVWSDQKRPEEPKLEEQSPEEWKQQRFTTGAARDALSGNSSLKHSTSYSVVFRRRTSNYAADVRLNLNSLQGELVFRS